MEDTNMQPAPGGKSAKWVIGIIVLVLLIWAVVATQKKENTQTQTKTNGEIFKIGVVIPLTGDVASYGESVKKGIEMAKKDLNAQNTELSYEDSKCDGKTAVDAVNKLVYIEKVQAIIGDLCSSATLAAAPVTQKNQVVLISPGSTSPKLSEVGWYMFRTVPSDALQGEFGAKLAYGKNFRKLAILHSNEDYGNGFAQVLTEAFKKLGGEIVADEAFLRTATDLRTQVTKIKAANPDAIYMISNSTDSTVASLKQLKELGVKATLFGSEGFKSPDIIKGAQEAAEGLMVSAVSAGTSDFIKKHNAVYGTDPGPFAAQSYDAFAALAKAVSQGAKTGQDAATQLHAMEFNGASGLVKFDEHGDVAGNYDVYTVKNGNFVLTPQE